jgi:hypothetical protein
VEGASICPPPESIGAVASFGEPLLLVLVELSPPPLELERPWPLSTAEAPSSPGAIASSVAPTQSLGAPLHPASAIATKTPGERPNMALLTE